MVWLDRCREVGLVWRAIQLLEAADAAAVGVLLAERQEVIESVTRLTANTWHWRAVERPPYSLIGILRLLHPRSG